MIASLIVCVSSSLGVLAANATVATPQNVTASAALGALTISWSDDHVANTTFVVTSTPKGKSCTVIALTECSIEVTDRTAWRFSVVAKSAGVRSAPSALSAPVATHLVIVLAGQSNAEGARSYVVDPTTHVNYFDAPFATNADTIDQITWLAWPKPEMAPPPSSEPVALTTPQLLSGTAIFGPEISLARTLYADTSDAVTIVKATYPSTSLAHQWRPSSANGLYHQMANFVRATMASDAARGQFDVLGSVVWFQGESDALLHNAKYQSELVALVHDLRRDLPLSPAAPLVLTKESIIEHEQYEQSHHGCASDNCARAIDGNTLIRHADEWVGHHLAHVVIVDSEGLDRSAISNYLHLSNVGELALGTKIARRLEAALAAL